MFKSKYNKNTKVNNSKQYEKEFKEKNMCWYKNLDDEQNNHIISN